MSGRSVRHAGSLNCSTAIHRKNNSGQEFRLIRGKVNARVCNVGGARQTSQRYRGDEFRPVVRRVGKPMKASSSPVSPMTGATQFTLILSGASSTARDFETRFTAPFEALYQVRPGRGRMPAVDPMFIIDPPPCLDMSGATARTI